MTKPSLLSVLITCLLGLGGAALLLFFAGVGKDNTTLLGAPMGYQSPPQPGNSDWGLTLAAACREHELEDAVVEPFTSRLEFTMTPRRSYYRAWLTGTQDGRRMKVHVVLTAPDQGEWVVTEWREEG